MRRRQWLLSLLLLANCQCEPAPVAACDQLRCGPGLRCDLELARCVVIATPGDDAGRASEADAGVVDAGTMAPTCASPPGCGGCQTDLDCQPGQRCDAAQATCKTWVEPPTAAFPEGGGSKQHCLPLDGGARPPCTDSCSHGFVCLGHECYLAGSTGPLQVTLRFPQAEDLDLHVVEPIAGGELRELWYSEPVNVPALGRLDLDSNAGCNIDAVNIENVIYPPQVTPTTGEYVVRVEYYQVCAATAPVPWEVTVRVGAEVRYFCGTLDPVTAHHFGGLGSGVTVARFAVP